MIFLGIDDTDLPGIPGTNQFSRQLVRQLSDLVQCHLIVRHQLSDDPRIPCTSKNSAAALWLSLHSDATVADLIGSVTRFIMQHFLPGSDPGFCVTEDVPESITWFGQRCQRELVTQDEARALARRHAIHLQGCGGTQDGVIGALAAVGLTASGNDGRIVQIGSWPDDLAGPQDIATLRTRNVMIRTVDGSRSVEDGVIDVGKHLRPNLRKRQIVLYAEPSTDSTAGGEPTEWQAIRLP